jgi:DNA-binding NarL/FixJ family response regulator
MSAAPHPIRILSVDDHPILRQGVAALVSGQADMSVVAEASNGREAIRCVHAGKKALSAEASYQLAEHATDDAFTPAEIRVLHLIAEGNANKEIAAQLSVSEETVKGQVRNILSKLGANDRTHAAMIGLKRGIIEF